MGDALIGSCLPSDKYSERLLPTVENALPRRTQLPWDRKNVGEVDPNPDQWKDAENELV